MLKTKVVFACFGESILYRETGDNTREVVSWVHPGKPRTRYLIKDGMFHGVCCSWYDNGQKKMDEPYENGKLHGFVRAWYENGHLERVVPFRRGRPHGIIRQWDCHGILSSVKLQVSRVFAEPHLLSYVNELLSKERMTARNIVRINNAELRRILIEDIGYEKFSQQLDPDVLDKDGDRALLRVNFHSQEEPLYLVKVRCPSTGAYYTLRVPPDMNTVKEAVAWTFGLTADKYLPIEET